MHREDVMPSFQGPKLAWMEGTGDYAHRESSAGPLLFPCPDMTSGNLLPTPTCLSEVTRNWSQWSRLHWAQGGRVGSFSALGAAARKP